MAATYIAVLTSKDAVRLELGDTDVPTNAMLQDEEIAHYLTLEGGSVLLAAARGAAAIAGKFARLVSTSVLGVKVEAQQQFEHYSRLAETLTMRAVRNGGTAVPYAGGITTSDVDARDADTGLVDPFFSRRTGDNPPVLRRDDGRVWP